MKYSSYVFIVLAVVSLTYGITQRSKATDLARELAEANQRSQSAEAEAIMQRDRAEVSRKQAMAAAHQAMEAQVRAEQALQDCQKKKR